MEKPELDHLVLGCLDLAAGEAALAGRFGVPSQGGGAHEGMGSHNKLWGLDGGEVHGAVYLELIAPDPAQAARADGTLPFGLHLEDVRARLAEGPRLLTWMARCDDLDGWAMRSAGVLGEPRGMRRGSLEWRLAVPSDSRRPFDGAHPGLIRWPDETTPPGEAMAGSGIALKAFTRTPDAQAGAALARVGLDEVLPEVEGQPTTLRAVLETPAGEVTLD